MTSTITTLAEAVFQEIRDDCFNVDGNLSATTVDGIIDLHAVVRAVLTALRDPPQHILDAAEAQDDHTTKYVQAADAKTHWNAMIDAILAEGNG